jgi:hypothetical protein
MAELTNPVRGQNIVDRFADYVVATANAGIVWGTNAKPFAEMPDANFGGTTGGKAIGITGANVIPASTLITAPTIYNALVAETNSYTRIRNLRALLFVTGGGGNTGSRPTAGYVYDQTRKANLNTSRLQSIGAPANAGVASGQIVSAGNLETLFNNLRTAYSAAAGNTVTIQVDVCHASCHSSCHGSRGRR